MTFDELTRLLFPRTNFGMKFGLERMRKALTALGDPHLCAQTLHVAGTNGKGSTCAFAESALRAAGMRVGLYTSPHLRHFCERIRVDGADLPEERAAALFAGILERVPWALDADGLTFFELATLLAFLAFAEASVQVMVIEVGLGGRLDATNVVAPLACAIAPLSLEHTQHLGPTLTHIAREKAGIIKEGVPCVSAGQAREAALVLQAVADRAGARLWRPGRDYRFESRVAEPFCYAGPGEGAWQVHAEPSLPGHHQRANAALACGLLEAASRRGLPITADHAARGLASARWPGRLQRISERPVVWLDGAHNPHAARALAASLPALLEGRSLQLVFGALADKDAAAMLAAIAPLAAGVHLCAPASPRALDPASLVASFPAARVYQSARAALDAARSAAGEGGAVLCCGSLYLVGELIGGPAAAMPGERL